MALADHGFSILEDLFSTAECDRFAARVDAINTRAAGSRCLLDQAWCEDLAVDLRSRLVGRSVEIGTMRAVQCSYFHKTADINWLVAWHQDRSIPVAAKLVSTELTGWSIKEGMTFVHAPDAVLSRMVAVRLHLDPSTPHNGPLRVIPSSHHQGTLALDRIQRMCTETAAGETPARRGLTRSLGRPDEERMQTTTGRPAALTCVVSKGGVLLMRPLLVHASSKSLTMEPRRVLHFVFGPPQLPGGLAWRKSV